MLIAVRRCWCSLEPKGTRLITIDRETPTTAANIRPPNIILTAEEGFQIEQKLKELDYFKLF